MKMDMSKSMPCHDSSQCCTDATCVKYQPSFGTTQAAEYFASTLPEAFFDHESCMRMHDARYGIDRPPKSAG